jgi:hypothetical protein
MLHTQRPAPMPRPMKKNVSALSGDAMTTVGELDDVDVRVELTPATDVDDCDDDGDDDNDDGDDDDVTSLLV